MCSFLGITCISAQDIDSVYSELLSLLDKKAIDWMESIEYTQRQALLLNLKSATIIQYTIKGRFMSR